MCEPSAQTGYAASSDGIIWEQHPDNPVLAGSGSGWDANHVGNPCVVWTGFDYLLYYIGKGSSYSIGVANISAGGFDPTPLPYAGNPVFDVAGQAWHSGGVYAPSVMNDDGTFKMWYMGFDNTNYRIGYAISTDGYTWTDYPSNPVFDLGTPGAWDDHYVKDPTVIKKDATTDIAILKIYPTQPLPVAVLGDSDMIQVAERVIAVGSPFGLEQTVTSGIISDDSRNLVIEGETYEDMIQTDAAINRGNSGGPLVNLKGEVIGITTAIYAPTGVFTGVGFAIPVNKVKSVIKKVFKDKV